VIARSAGTSIPLDFASCNTPSDYTRLKGTGTFTETQNLNYLGVGTGSITLVGTMHTD